jgi:hypothetical protein
MHATVRLNLGETHAGAAVRALLVGATATREERRHLASLARRVARVARGAAIPAGWSSPAFAARVREYRRQLEPHRGRDLLAYAYGREARRHGPLPAARAEAIDLAYAIRWLEMGATRPQVPDWVALVAPQRADPGAAVAV